MSLKSITSVMTESEKIQANKDLIAQIAKKSELEYLVYKVELYKKNGYTKKQIFDIVLSTKSKIDIISDMKFSFTFDSAIPQNLWSDYKNPKFEFMSLNDHISVYSNGDKYRLGFRVFPIVRLYKRFLTQIINGVFDN
jgi:hypothetical protein